MVWSSNRPKGLARSRGCAEHKDWFGYGTTTGPLTKVDDYRILATSMRLMRGLVFGTVSLLPALFAGIAAYFVLGGTTGDEWETWMYGPCYLVPGLIVGGSLILGLRDEGEIKQ